MGGEQWAARHVGDVGRAFPRLACPGLHNPWLGGPGRGWLDREEAGSGARGATKRQQRLRRGGGCGRQRPGLPVLTSAVVAADGLLPVFGGGGGGAGRGLAVPHHQAQRLPLLRLPGEGRGDGGEGSGAAGGDG